MKQELRVGDYLARRKNKNGDDGVRFEVISISKDEVRILNLKNAWEIIEVKRVDLSNDFCADECIRNKAESIEDVVKKIQENIKIKNCQNVTIDLGKIEAIIFPIYEDLLKLIVFERKSWSGDIKTSSYDLPSELCELKEAYPLLSNNIWAFTDSDREAS